MIFHILVVSVLTWSMIICEPPVNSYLPPSDGSSRPSSQYRPQQTRGGGASSTFDRGNGAQNQQTQFQNGGNSDASNLKNQYGPPLQRSGKENFGGLSQGGHDQRQSKQQPSSQYGVPGQFGGSHGGSNERLTSGSSGFGQDSYSRNQKPETSYGPPPVGDFQTSNVGGSGRSLSNQQLGRQGKNDPYNTQNGHDSQSDSPSTSYGTPEFSNNNEGPRSGQLRGQNSNEGNDFNEPAKYQFSYDVDNEETGTKFGHSEQRDGDLATGEYNVVLPDGRKQVVEYEAGLQGYKPQIRYEGSIGGQHGRQGIQQGGSNSFSGGDNNNGFGAQNGSPSKYQESPTFGESDANQSGGGYPRGGPGANGVNGPSSSFSNNGLGENGYSSSQHGSSGSGNKDNGGSQHSSPGSNGGYPSGAPQSGAFTLPNSHQSAEVSSYPSGRSQDGGGFSSGGEGYPSGGPNGLRGSGY